MGIKILSGASLHVVWAIRFYLAFYVLDVKLKVSLLKLTVFVIFAVSIYFGAYTYLYELNMVEVDITSIVTNVIDGDTFDIATGDRIRLADVDCPERWEPGFHEATLTLTRMIGNKRIHLDVDYMVSEFE
jgi:endonuclease YncB( thermonuclease family)